MMVVAMIMMMMMGERSGRRRMESERIGRCIRSSGGIGGTELID